MRIHSLLTSVAALGCKSSAFLPTPPHQIHKRNDLQINSNTQTSLHLQQTPSCTNLKSLINSFSSDTKRLKDINLLESPIHQPLQNSTLLLSVRAINKRSGYICMGYLSHCHFKYEIHLSTTATDHIALTNVVCEGVVDQFVVGFHRLFLEYLVCEREVYENERDGVGVMNDVELKVVMSPEIDAELSNRLNDIGFRETSSSIGLDLELYLPFLNDFIFRHRSSEHGCVALNVLKMLSQRRVPYDFENQRTSNNDETFVALQKNVISSTTVENVMDIVNEIRSKRMLSMNPDSVDGLPSLHLNLISDGKPLFDLDVSLNEEKEEPSFAQYISQLTKIVQPELYDNLLPSVQKLLNSSTLEISDVFIRNYGHVNETNDDNCDLQLTRYTLSPHYDITAYATCVITLDSTASTGRNGLYTIPKSSRGSTNNAALRQFFPLDKGDGVIHTFDILHGVDVDPDLKQSRTSLIIWFNNGNRQWLQRNDDISQFVSGLVLEEHDEVSAEAIEKYISSCQQGNLFAMTALAQLCYENKIPNSMYPRIKRLIPPNPFWSEEEEDSTPQNLANTLWYHAAIPGGNPIAQYGLGNSLMSQYVISGDLSMDEKKHLFLIASVLFTMAYNNGHEESFGALERLMGIECRRLNEGGVEIPSEEFFASPVVRVLRLSLDDEA